jgi:hypothetical protein
MFFSKKDDTKPLKYPTAASFWDQEKVKTIATSTTSLGERSQDRSATFKRACDRAELAMLPVGPLPPG